MRERRKRLEHAAAFCAAFSSLVKLKSRQIYKVDRHALQRFKIYKGVQLLNVLNESVAIRTISSVIILYMCRARSGRKWCT